MPRKKFDSGRIRVLILNVHAECPEPDIPPYFRFSREYGFVQGNIGTMAQAISHSDGDHYYIQTRHKALFSHYNLILRKL